MPISVRLPADIEAQLAGFAERGGLSKSAVIVRSIREFLVKHAQPSSFQIYQEAMREANGHSGDAGHEALEHRPLKQQLRKTIRNKHAERSSRASEALAKSLRNADQRT